MGIIMKNWGAVGVIFLLTFSSVRLGISSSVFLKENYKNMTNEYWIAFICTCLVFSLGEGRSLHKNFNPMVVRRHKELCKLRTEERTYFHIIFAPLYCTGHLPIDSSFRAWICTFFIAAMIVALKYVPVECRVAISSGVSLALFFGSISLIYQLNRRIVFTTGVLVFPT